MSDLIADVYVLYWKYFEGLSSDDEDFLAAATCSFGIFLAFANIAQVMAIFIGRNSGSFVVSSKVGQLTAGTLLLILGVIGMKIYLKSRVDLQTHEGITNRYSRFSQSKKVTITILSFANLAVFLAVHQFIAI